MKTPPLSLEDAQARLLALAIPLPVERIDIAGAQGRYLAAPLLARRTQPSADLSAMDGYAVADDGTAGPWQVIGESAAGRPYAGGTLAIGHAVRIATGAVLPAGAGSVILQEDLIRTGDQIALTGDAPVPPAKHIRRRGMDFTEGSCILAEGTRLGPAQLALAIAAGHRHLPLRRRPRIAVIDSGDELASDGEACAPHQIPASNGPMIVAMAAALPCDIRRLGPVADDLGALTAVLDEAADADVIVTSGGASVGDHDLLRPALAAIGADIAFWRIAIKPGKPLLVATRPGPRGDQIVLGLPGNPVSSHVTAFLFLLPLLRALMGAAAPLPRRFLVRLAEPLRPSGARREFLRATWDGVTVRAQAVQDSGALASLAASNVLIDRAANAAGLDPGEDVFAYLLENGGIA